MKEFNAPCCANCNFCIEDIDGFICEKNGCLIDDINEEYCETYYERKDKYDEP